MPSSKHPHNVNLFRKKKVIENFWATYLRRIWPTLVLSQGHQNSTLNWTDSCTKEYHRIKAPFPRSSNSPKMKIPKYIHLNSEINFNLPTVNLIF